MILVDAPLRWGDHPSCHLVSDQPGEAGTAELLEFARRLGLPGRRPHLAGTPREHFDLFGRFIEEALRLGARRVDRRELVAVLRRKRAAAP